MEWKKVETTLSDKQGQVIEDSHEHYEKETADILSLHGINLSADDKTIEITKEEKALQKLQQSDTREALRSCSRLVREISGKKTLIKDLLAGKHEIGKKALSKVLTTLREQIKDLNKGFSEIAEGSPEAFLAVHSREMRAWRRQLESGRLVVTPYVQEKLDEVVEHLGAGRQNSNSW